MSDGGVPCCRVHRGTMNFCKDDDPDDDCEVLFSTLVHVWTSTVAHTRQQCIFYPEDKLLNDTRPTPAKFKQYLNMFFKDSVLHLVLPGLALVADAVHFYHRHVATIAVCVDGDTMSMFASPRTTPRYGF